MRLRPPGSVIRAFGPRTPRGELPRRPDDARNRWHSKTATNEIAGAGQHTMT